MGRSIASAELRQAKGIAIGAQTHGFGINGNAVAEIDVVGEVAFMKIDFVFCCHGQSLFLVDRSQRRRVSSRALETLGRSGYRRSVSRLGDGHQVAASWEQGDHWAIGAGCPSNTVPHIGMSFNDIGSTI